MEASAPQNTANTGLTGNSPASDTKRAAVIIALIIILVIAFACIGYLASQNNSCNKQCPNSSTYVCPPGFTVGCDKCTGKNYCGEAQCSSSVPCSSNPYAKSQGRGVCVIPSGGSQGYCYQCDVNATTPCPTGFKCVRGWCVQCTQNSDCVASTYNANANGTCVNNACNFTATQCLAGSVLKPVGQVTGAMWPFTTNKYSNNPSATDNSKGVNNCVKTAS